MKSFIQSIVIAMIAFCAVVAPPASAQNALVGNVKTKPVYDGIMLAQLKSAFAASTINNDQFTVMDRRTPEGTPYLAVTAPSLPFAIYLACIDDSYSGEGDSVFAGYSMFVEVSFPELSHEDVSTFNFQNRFVKMSPNTNASGVFSMDVLMAGGVAEETILLSLIPFFGGLERFVSLTPSQTTVDFQASEKKSHRFAVENDREILFDKNALMKLAALSKQDDNPIAERFIEELIDRVAN